MTESAIANTLPSPILVIGPEQEILYVNPAAEQFFDTGATILLKQTLSDLLVFDIPPVPAGRPGARAQCLGGRARCRSFHARSMANASPTSR